MNGKVNKRFCTNIMWSDNNTFLPRDAPITSFYNLVPFSKLNNSYIKCMSNDVCNYCVSIICVGEIHKKGL